MVDWVWQLPQNILGYLFTLIFYTTTTGSIIWGNKFCVCIKEYIGSFASGRYIFIDKNTKEGLTETIERLSGYVTLSKKLGVLYVPLVIIPLLVEQMAGVFFNKKPITDYFNKLTFKMKSL